MTGVAGLPEHLLVLERGWLSANSILFKGRNETAVVDTGYVTHSAQTLALIGNALGGRPLDRILNTHLHSDHCGGNAALQLRYPGTHTSIPAAEASSVERWDEGALSFRHTGQECPRFHFEAVLHPGVEVSLGELPWQIHAAPGHDPHSIILFEPASRTLISADALWENGFGVVFPELVGEASFDEVAATLDLIEALSPRIVIPGHGRIFEEVGAALKSARRRLEGFAGNPLKHARHALKVLLKFKLLEAQSMRSDAWKAWVARTPCLETVRLRFFASLTLEQLVEELLEELIALGVASREGATVSNRG